MSNNPLTGFSRIPKLAIHLPSGGKYSNIKGGQSEMSDEVQVKAMTGVDELHLRNPDALLSGESVAKVIKSCTGISDISNMPNVDVSALLLAIRYASFGRTMDVEITCPKCSTESDLEVDLEGMMGTIQPIESDFVGTVSESNLKIKVRPHAYKTVQKIALATFTESKAMQMIGDVTNAATLAMFDQSYTNMANLSVETVVDAIISIALPDGTEITDRSHIKEFIQSEADIDTMKIITDLMEAANKSSYDGNVNVTCSNKKCKHEWNTEIEVNASNFFGKDSNN